MSKLSELNRKRQSLIFRIKGLAGNISKLIEQYKGEKDTPYIITKREATLLKEVEATLNAILDSKKTSWNYLKQFITKN